MDTTAKWHSTDSQSGFASAWAVAGAQCVLVALALSALGYVGVAHAARGDIDSAFGVEGRMEAVGTVVSLPDDNFVSCAPADDVGFVIRRFDADGRLDPAFGDGGEIVVPLPAGATPYMGECRWVAASGGLLFAGYLRDLGLNQIVDVVLRVDGNGKLDSSFGGRRDGIYRLTDAPLQINGGFTNTLAAITVDASGRVLLADRHYCSHRTSVVRLMPNGEPDATFGTNGRAEVPAVVDLCSTAVLLGARDDGSIVVGTRGAVAGLDANGALDATFGANGLLTDGVPDSDGWLGRLLPDGSILIIGNRRENMSANSELRKFDRQGRPDNSFGGGTGVVSLALGPALSGDAGARVGAGNFVLEPDGSHLYVQLSVLHGDGTVACNSGIARIAMDGTPDTGFGKQGLTCLDYGAFPFWLTAVQSSGAPLFRPFLDGAQVFRLLVDAIPSRGMLTLVTAHGRAVYVGESDGSASVTVARVAGRDGAVGARYGTGFPPFDDALYHDGPGDGTGLATEETDYQRVSGLLEWADGDDAQRTVSVPILDDNIAENREIFGILMSEPRGGALVNGASANVEIDDDDPAASPTPTPTTTPTPQSSSGGGSISGVMLALLGLLRRPSMNRRTAKAESRRHDRRAAPQRWSWKQNPQI